MTDDLARALNLRDLGGVRAAGGATVRRGMAYRSAALAGLAGERLDRVRALGVRTIIDLRRDDERAQHPTPWQAIGCVDYWARAHQASDADLTRSLGEPTADDRRARMIGLYRTLPYVQAESYARLFRALAAGEGPVLFHCAVGKDRTGGAAALILAALGVSRDAIAEDYAVTDRFDIVASPHLAAARLTPERIAALAPVLRTDPAYLDALFAGIEARSGSVAGYLADTLSLGEDGMAAFRRAMLVPA